MSWRGCRSRGARLGFTSWEHDQPSPSPAVGAIPDYRPHLAAAGLVVEIYEEAEEWRRRWLAMFDGIRAAAAALQDARGAEGASRLLRWAHMRPLEASFSRQVFVVARRA